MGTACALIVACCGLQWSYQGVLLLNAVLTVRAHTPASHSKKGWETLTDAAISALSARRKGLVFLMWGKFAQQKELLIDTKKHHVLKAAHPSGFSANKVDDARHSDVARSLHEFWEADKKPEGAAPMCRRVSLDVDTSQRPTPCWRRKGCLPSTGRLTHDCAV